MDTHLVTAQIDVVPKFGGHAARLVNGVPLPTVQLEVESSCTIAHAKATAPIGWRTRMRGPFGGRHAAGHMMANATARRRVGPLQEVFPSATAPA